MVHGKTFVNAETKAFLKPSEVRALSCGSVTLQLQISDGPGGIKVTATGEQVEEIWAKMSKVQVHW